MKIIALQTILISLTLCLGAFTNLAADLKTLAEGPQSSLPQEPFHGHATDEAWGAYQTGQYQAAITNADQCIATFADAASRSQAALEAQRASLPIGKPSQAEKQHLAQYQILHDVATCLLIKGWAEEKLGHKAEARKAYAAAKKYTYARCSRPAGDSFWSPAEKAAERLGGL